MTQTTLQGTFFQFPIVALRGIDSRGVHNTMQDIVNYCLIQAAKDCDEYADDSIRIATSYSESHDVLDEFDSDDGDQVGYLYAAAMLNVKVCDLRPSRIAWDSYFRISECDGGKSLVRLPAGLLWEFEQGGFDYFDVCLLCAVYSCIGSSDAKLVRQNLIRARMLGFDKPAGVAIEQVNLRKLRYRLGKLESRSLFFRVSPNRRDVYFGRNSAKLIESTSHIVANKIAKKQFSKSSLDALLKAKIDQKVSAIRDAQ